MNKYSNARVEFPFFTILFLIFLTLKLTGTIAWSWWWVTSPIWGPFALLAVVLALTGAFFGLGVASAYVIDKLEGRSRRKGQWNSKRQR